MTTSLSGNAALAKRYAKALFELATDAKAQSVVAKQLDALDTMAQDNKALQQLFTSPRISRQQKENAILALLRPSKPHTLTLHLVGLLARNGRLNVLSDVIASYQAMVRETQNIAEAKVISATALTNAQLSSLTKTLEEATGKSVKLSAEVDPSLIGGLVVRMGSKMIDHSLAHHLERLKQSLKHAATAA